jgi:predicted DNA-binding protein
LLAGISAETQGPALASRGVTGSHSLADAPGRRQMSAGVRAVLPGVFAMVILGYTKHVKTAISLPDETYEQATKQAAELGISRSEFFARAARSYLDELASHSLTQQINEALQTARDDSNAAAAAAGREYLAGQDDW